MSRFQKFAAGAAEQNRDVRADLMNDLIAKLIGGR